MHLREKFAVGEVTSPSMYHLPHSEMVPEVEITAITMRGDRPIYRNHQTTPDTDHQTLPRLCHEAALCNRLTEMGLTVTDVRFPTWGAALPCILQFDYPREGFVNDALMTAMGAPWLNTKMVVAVIRTPRLTTRARSITPSRPALIRRAISSSYRIRRVALRPVRTAARRTRAAAHRREDRHRWTRKSRHNPADFERAWPINWGKVRLQDYL